MNIKINVVGTQDVTNEMLAQFNSKLQKLENFFEKILSTHVWLKSTRYLKIVEVKVVIPKSPPIFIESTGKKFADIFDLVIESIQHTASTKKEKRIDIKRRKEKKRAAAFK